MLDTDENNIAQPKTDKWLSSPSHFAFLLLLSVILLPDNVICIIFDFLIIKCHFVAW